MHQVKPTIASNFVLKRPGTKGRSTTYTTHNLLLAYLLLYLSIIALTAATFQQDNPPCHKANYFTIGLYMYTFTTSVKRINTLSIVMTSTQVIVWDLLLFSTQRSDPTVVIKFWYLCKYVSYFIICSPPLWYCIWPSHTHTYTDVPIKGKALYFIPQTQSKQAATGSPPFHMLQKKINESSITSHTSQNYSFPNNIKWMCNLEIDAPRPGFFSCAQLTRPPSTVVSVTWSHQAGLWLLWLGLEVGGGAGGICCSRMLRMLECFAHLKLWHVIERRKGGGVTINVNRCLEADWFQL